MGVDVRPALWVIAGANGVGKTRYAREHIEAVTGSRRFVNLDEIARGLSPFDRDAEQVAAARIVIKRLDNFIAGRDWNGTPTITLETTMSGRTYLGKLRAARRAGIAVHLLYFSVINPSICVERVRRRVLEGGHDVAEADILRRFDRSIRNFTAYAEPADTWRVIDNNSIEPRIVAVGEGPGLIEDFTPWDGLPAVLSDQLEAMQTGE